MTDDSSRTDVKTIFTLTMLHFMAFVVQPAVGYFADRYRSRIFIIGGPLLTILFVSLAGRAGSFYGLLFFVMIASIGSSLFHPSTAGMIANYAGRHFGFCISIFNMGGTLALVRLFPEDQLRAKAI